MYPRSHISGAVLGLKPMWLPPDQTPLVHLLGQNFSLSISLVLTTPKGQVFSKKLLILHQKPW